MKHTEAEDCINDWFDNDWWKIVYIPKQKQAMAEILFIQYWSKQYISANKHKTSKI